MSAAASSAPASITREAARRAIGVSFLRLPQSSEQTPHDSPVQLQFDDLGSQMIRSLRLHVVFLRRGCLANRISIPSPKVSLSERVEFTNTTPPGDSNPGPPLFIETRPVRRAPRPDETPANALPFVSTSVATILPTAMPSPPQEPPPLKLAVILVEPVIRAA
jgi:hypothetical protein